MNATAGSSTRVALWTAVITATATIMTAFIGIVPAIRRVDHSQIALLTKEVETLNSALSQSYSITGSVRTKNNNTPVTDAILVAAPVDNSRPLDDTGKFVFQNMVNKPYWIVLQTQDGKLRRVLISPSDPKTDTSDLTITYNFAKE